MREDQYLRLQKLEEDLTEQMLFEADPKHWPGNGLTAMEMTQTQRGDRFWSKKNAVATVSLTMRVGALLGNVHGRGPAPSSTPEGEGDADGERLLDEEISAAEKEAKALLSRLEKATAPGR